MEVRGLGDMPEEVKNELLRELLKDKLPRFLMTLAGQKPEGEDGAEDQPHDATAEMMIGALHEGSVDVSEADPVLLHQLRGLRRRDDPDPRRPATPAEASLLVQRAGPCRFQPGDVVRWTPSLHEPGYSFPKLGMACVVTQVFNPPMHDPSEFGTNGVAVRNDIAIAYWHEGTKSLHEYTVDSRRFDFVDDD